jgi:hypothetical protein
MSKVKSELKKSVSPLSANRHFEGINIGATIVKEYTARCYKLFS